MQKSLGLQNDFSSALSRVSIILIKLRTIEEVTSDTGDFSVVHDDSNAQGLTTSVYYCCTVLHHSRGFVSLFISVIREG